MSDYGYRRGGWRKDAIPVVAGVPIKRPCEPCERGEGGAASIAAHQSVLDDTALAPSHAAMRRALRAAVDAGKKAKGAR